MGAAEEDVLGDGRLLKRVLRPGAGAPPRGGGRVEVHYETALASGGGVIDSSHEHGEPFAFTLGEGDVLEAWDLGVATMQPGEKAEFVADASLAYGEEGGGDEIPPGAALRFTVELLAKRPSQSEEAAADDERQPDEGEMLQRAAQAKDRGNGLMKEGQFSEARTAYDEALGLLRGLHDTSAVDVLRSRSQLRLSSHLNLAQCCLKLEDFAAAARHATEALSIEPESCKALYRRSVARMAEGSLEEARADLREALRLDPQNAEVRARLDECKHKLAECERWHRSAFGGIFGKAAVQPAVARDLAGLPRVWMDFQIGCARPRRVSFVLYSDTVPRTAGNFRALCTGERGVGACGQPLHYKRTLVHRVVPRSLIEAGDIENYDGTGGESIYGRTFADEGFGDGHSRRGLLSMASRGPDTNGSRFFITLRSLPQFDGKHVVFGEVLCDKTCLLDDLEKVETTYPDKPVTQVAVVDCGAE